MGPFELEKQLGRGGMAETFVAVRYGPAGFEQRVCLKRILPELARDPNMVRLFLDEARNTASLRHSNIVQVIDFGTDNDQHYLALELVDGMDLHRLLDALPEGMRGLPADLVAHIGVELSAALDYAHNAPNLAGQHGIFHRDLSPGNILVSTNGDLKLTDFGVAKAAGQARATAAGVVRGKVEYMAPEYGMGGEYDARCDQFSLGVLLFETLTGARPYLGNSQGEVLHRARQGFHKPLATLTGSVPPQLSDAIQRMIRPKGDQRFDSMAEVTKALLDIAPGPRGRAALAQLVSDARAGSIPPPKAKAAAPAEDAFAATMVSTPEKAIAAISATASGTSALRSAPPTGSPASRSGAPGASTPVSQISLPVHRMTPRVGWVVAVAIVLLLAWGVRALLSSEAPAARVAKDTPIATKAPTASSDAVPTSPVPTATNEDGLPVGVDPPPVPLMDPNTNPNGSTPRAQNPSTSTRVSTPPAAQHAPETETKAPRELIHRQKHDLLKPKDW